MLQFDTETLGKLLLEREVRPALVVDLETRVLEANRASRALTGTETTPPGRLHDWLKESSRDCFDTAWRRAIAGERVRVTTALEVAPLSFEPIFELSPLRVGAKVVGVLMVMVDAAAPGPVVPLMPAAGLHYEVALDEAGHVGRLVRVLTGDRKAAGVECGKPCWASLHGRQTPCERCPLEGDVKDRSVVRPHVDALVALASADVLVGPAVAWSGTDYVVAWSNGQQLFTQRVSPDGTKRTAPGVNVAGLTSLDVECLANGQCFVGWVGAGGATVSEVDGGVVATAPFVTGAIALSNDGVHLCGAWPDDGGFGYACVDEQHQLVDEAVVPWADAMVGDLQLSAGRPGVLAWSDGVSLWTTRVGEVPTLLGQGFAPAVATELDGNGARGVVVATRFDAEFSLRAFMRGVAWPDDAGVAVDGGHDAGREDAGLEDAGLDAGDAGTTHIDFTTSGCATGGPALLWFVLLPLTLALRSGERAGVRGRTSSE